MSQIIRSFEYLSTFGYHRHILSENLKAHPLYLKTELYMTQACVTHAEAELGKYLTEKLVEMAVKCATYKV